MNICFVKLNGLGDSVVCLPALLALKEVVPRAQTTVITNAIGAELFRGFADRTIVLHSGWRGVIDLLVSIRKHKIDVVLVSSDTSSRIILALSIARVKKKIGFSNPKASFLFDLVVPFREEHHGVLNRRLIDVAFGGALATSLDSFCLVPLSSSKSVVLEKIQRSGMKSGKLVTIHLGANRPSRRWPVLKFIELTRELLAQGRIVVFIGGTSERPLASEVTKSLEISEACNLCGELTIDELGYLIAMSNVFVGHSSGPLHLAYLQGVPSVSLWGAASDVIWGPFSDHHLHTLVRHSVPCSPCERPDCFSDVHLECMKGIGVGAVLQEINRALM